MKNIALLLFIELIVVVCGLAQVDNYSISIEGPPSQLGLPELSYEKSDEPLSVQPEVLASKLSERSLIYRFHLHSGTYDHFILSNHGVPLPAVLAIHDYWGREIAKLNITSPSSPDAAVPLDGKVSLPAPGLLSIVKWSLSQMWLGILVVVLFFILQRPLAFSLQAFLAAPASRFRLGIIDGKPVLLTIIVLGTVWLALGVPGAVRFDNNDDPSMQMLADGAVTGHPSEYLIFINVLVGLLLKNLYLLIPQIPWYPLFFLSMVLFCLAGIAFLLLREDVYDRFCWLCLFGIVFGTYFVMHLQFTSTAYLLGLLGMLIFSLSTSRRSLIAAIALVVVGSLIRFESFLLLFLTTAGAAWFLSRRQLSHKAIFFVSILFLAWTAKTFDTSYYSRHDDWRAYQEYNASRGGLHVMPKLTFSSGNQAAYDHVGWSKNDFDMFSNHWLFQDPAAFSAEKLAYLNQHLLPDVSTFDITLKILIAIFMAPSAVLFFCVIFLYKMKNFKRAPLMLAVIVGPMAIILCYLVLTARIPTRVVVPVLYATSLFLMIASREDGETCRRLGSRSTLALLFASLTVFSLEGGWAEAEENNQDAHRLEASLKELAPYSDQALVCSIYAIKLRKLDPFTAQSDTQKLNLIHLAWSWPSPSFNLELQRYGATSLFKSLASDPKFWLMVPTSQWDRADSFSRYMQEHYQQKIKMVPVIFVDGKPAIFPDFTVMKAVPDRTP